MRSLFKQIFRRINAPTKTDLEAVLQQLSICLARMLVKEGVLTQDMETSSLTLDHLEANPMQQVPVDSHCTLAWQCGHMTERSWNICVVMWPGQRVQNSGWR